MSEEKFTKGPWYIKQSEEIRLPYSINVSSTRITRITIIDTPGGQYQSRHVIAQVAKGNGRGEANAALIAAAPEMYEQLKRHCALCMMMHPDCDGCEICDTGKVLKKARGEE